MRLSIAGLLVAAALLPAHSGHAQLRGALPALPAASPPPLHSVPALSPAPVGPAPLRSLVMDARQEEGASPVWLAVSGAAGGALGLVAGAVIGGALSGGGDDDCHDFCFGEGFVPGAVVGEAAGVALGVHLANGRRGSLGMDLLASGGIAAVGVAAMQADRRIVYVLPVSQIVGTIYAERASRRQP